MFTCTETGNALIKKAVISIRRNSRDLGKMEKAEIVQAYPVQNLLLFRGKYLELLLPVAFP